MQREAARVPGIDQLVRSGRCLGEDAEPTERIRELVGRELAVRDARAADAVKAVAARNEVARELVRGVTVCVGDARAAPGEVVDRDVGDLEAERNPPLP